MSNSQNPYFFFDGARLQALAEANKESYKRADPFPHIVFDDFLPTDVTDKVLSEFPPPEASLWHEYKNSDTENLKLACEDDTKMGGFTRHLLSQFNSSTFAKFIESLTGIPGIIPDPHFRGGGLHQTKPGGFLSIHADFNKYKRLGVNRRLNLLLYLNKDWKDEYGGHLELWDKEMTGCKKKIAPIFNRAVIFSTTDFSNHGHPDPLKTPPPMTRKSLALYYYTAIDPEAIPVIPHTTLFRERPGKDSFKKPTLIRRAISKLRRMIG